MARAIKTSTALRNVIADALNIDRDAAESIRRELVKQTTSEDVAVEMTDYTEGFAPELLPMVGTGEGGHRTH